MTTQLPPPGAPGRPPVGDAQARVREPIFRHPMRVVVIVGVLLGVASLISVLLSATDTSRVSETASSPVRRGAEVEGVNPQDGEILQDAITADLRDDLTGVLVIDGVEVPEDQTDRVEPLGQVSFRPGPGKDIVRFEPSEIHQVTVLYWAQRKERPASPGSFSWTFRAVN